MVPAVSRSRRREVGDMIKDLTACFDGLADPRVTHQCDHRLIDILVIAVSAVIACAESWKDIERACRKLWRRPHGWTVPTAGSRFINLRKSEADREQAVLLAHRPGA